MGYPTVQNRLDGGIEAQLRPRLAPRLLNLGAQACCIAIPEALISAVLNRGLGINYTYYVHESADAGYNYTCSILLIFIISIYSTRDHKSPRHDGHDNLNCHRLQHDIEQHVHFQYSRYGRYSTLAVDETSLNVTGTLVVLLYCV